MNIISKNLKDTEKLAEKILKNLKPKEKGATVFGFYGDLGTGKTTLVQFLVKKIGIKRKVNSPTFVIMKRYSIKHKYFENIFHLDAYRLKNEKDLAVLNWQEIITDPKHLVFIEWPEKVQKALPKKHHKIEIFHTPKGYRKFKIK